MSVTNTTSATTADSVVQIGSTSATNPKATLDKDGFLKMFVAQMQNQDPSSSQDPNESTQQMAMFSMVEQMTNLVMQEQSVSQQLGTQSAVGLAGGDDAAAPAPAETTLLLPTDVLVDVLA